MACSHEEGRRDCRTGLRGGRELYEELIIIIIVCSRDGFVVWFAVPPRDGFAVRATGIVSSPGGCAHASVRFPRCGPSCALAEPRPRVAADSDILISLRWLGPAACPVFTLAFVYTGY